MKALLVRTWESLRESYWFIPTVMTLASMVAALVLVEVDHWLGPEWTIGVPLIQPSRAEGARSLLSTIAGSLITVAGVAFSITIAAVAYASSQFGPHLLTSFMRDRGNQYSLGTFIATFVYCLLVLRTIRNPSDGSLGMEDGAVEAFVPQISVLVGVLLMLASVGVLIFYIHHVPESIHAARVAYGVGDDLLTKIETIFPETLGQGEQQEETGDVADEVLGPDFAAQAVPVTAGGDGYLKYIDGRTLMRVARTHDLQVRVEYRPGDYLSRENTLARVWPPDRVDDDVAAKLREVFILGHHRTQAQDVMFLVQQLNQIIARALSPGINDPFTAQTCMDWLGAALAKFATRRAPSPCRHDDQGHLRVVAPPISFAEFTAGIYGQLRPYVCKDVNAALYMMTLTSEVAVLLRTDYQRRVLLAQVHALWDACEQSISHADDRQRIHARYQRCVHLLTQADGNTFKLLRQNRRLDDGAVEQAKQAPR